uniref:Cytochrome b561 domain-containing protein n=1 Tax=Salix viminalis TaxID=40686 RepID=A0A6N2KF95_SALVM
MQMKMFHSALGLLVLTSSTLMIEVSAVGLHLTVSGKPKLGILVLHHLIGVAVAFVNRWREWRKCISDAGKVMKQSGIQVSETSPPVI